MKIQQIIKGDCFIYSYKYVRLWKHSKYFWGKNDCKTCKDDHVVILSNKAL